jgi:hypothetical protein
MDNIKFFRVLWRVNAIIILALSIVFIILMVGLFKNTSYQTRSVYMDDVFEQESERKARWNLGKFEELNESGLFIAPLMSKQSFSIGFSKKKKTKAIRNYLFVDINQKNSFWLFEQNDFVIEGIQYVTEAGISRWYSDSREKAIALFFVVYKVDTNNDNAIKDNDLGSVALTKLDGSAYTEIENEIENIRSIKVTNAGTDLVLFYEKEGKLYVSKYSLTDFKKISEMEIDTNGWSFLLAPSQRERETVK